ncbi:MAG: PQQ-binding-like beta-propeller repeat protein [Planctomycetes bacterium]|nr:PQQ-binding-like beta-propeller repeat protein [Planctomycetota bacterium]
MARGKSGQDRDADGTRRERGKPNGRSPSLPIDPKYLKDDEEATARDGSSTILEGKGGPLPARVPESGGGSSLGGTGPAAPTGSAAGPSIPGFEILAELGRGGMGVVYKARDLGLDRVVALKILPGGFLASGNAEIRFQREARAAASLSHPAIVATYSVGKTQGTWFIVQEFVEGKDLERRLAARAEPPSPREAAEILLPVAEAVAHAHARGVIHRDLKPANILVGEDGRPKLTDFGLARREGESMVSRTGDVMGTPEYMSPEQVEGDPSRIGPASDVYGLGAILYRILAERPPFTAKNTVALFRKILVDDPVSPSQANPRVGSEISAIAMKCLEKAPARRYAGAADLARDLSAYLRGEPITARPPGLASRLARRIRRHRWRVVTAGLAAVAAFALAWIFAAPATLEVRTTPPGAEILLGGEEIGTSPVSVTVWPPGTRQMDVRHPLCEPLSRTVQLEAGKLHEEVVPLVPFAGVLRVSSDPLDAEIWLDGEFTGEKTPAEISQVPAGVHLLALRLADHKEEALQVTIANREEVTVHRALTPTFGTLRVTYHPKGAKIEIRPAGSGSREGTSPAVFEKLPPGPCEIRIWTTGGEPDVTETREIVPGPPIELAGEVVGKLTIHVNPEGSRGTLELVGEEGGLQVKREFSAPLVDAELPVGQYRLRLTGPGDPQEEHWTLADDTIDVLAENPETRYYRLLEKWRVLWTVDTGAGKLTSPALGDLDGDGTVEVVVGSETGKLQVFRGRTGELLWTYDVGDVHGGIWGDPVLGDLNADGTLDVLVISISGLHAVSGATGRELWIYQIEGAVLSSPALADLDGDGIPDSLVGSSDMNLHAVCGSTGKTLWVYETGASSKNRKNYLSRPTLADLDGDGVLDAVVGSYENKLHAVCGSTGKRLWAYETGQESSRDPALGDLDGDGLSDVVVGSANGKIYAVSGRTGERLWTYGIGGVIFGSTPALADLDADGVVDAVVGCEGGTIQAVSGSTGTSLWRYATGGNVRCTAALGDLDGDGVPDAVVGSMDNNLYAVSGRSGHLLWAYETGGQISNCSPALWDLDGDGSADAVVGSNDGKLHAVSGRVSRTDWAYGVGGEVPWACVAVAADLDGDASPDGFVGSYDRGLHAVSGATGKRLWVSATPHLLSVSSAASDLDDDGLPDAIATSLDHKIHAVSGKTGGTLWSYETGGPVRSAPACADLDGDGVRDVVAVSEDAQVHAVSGRTGTALWASAFPSAELARVSPADLDADGVADVVVATGDRLYGLSGKTGGTIWAYATLAHTSSAALAELDGDGVLDAVVSSRSQARVQALSGKTGTVLWDCRLGFPPVFMSLADLDVDAVHDAVVTNRYGKIAVISGRTGLALWSHDSASNGFTWRAAVARIDGDEVPDVVVGFFDGKLHAVSGRTGQTLWTLDLGEPIHGDPVISDLDGDGRVEILVPAGSTLYCLRVPEHRAADWNPGLGIEGTAAQALLFDLGRRDGAADRFLDQFPRHEAAGRVHLHRARERRLAGDLSGAKADLESARAKGLRSVELYREILNVAPGWDLPAEDPRLAIAAGMEGVELAGKQWNPNDAPLDADVLGAAAFQAYRDGRLGEAMALISRYFTLLHRAADAEPWLARARFLAEFERALSSQELGSLFESNQNAFRDMDASDRARVEAELDLWKKAHPEEAPPALPW